MEKENITLKYMQAFKKRPHDVYSAHLTISSLTPDSGTESFLHMYSLFLIVCLQKNKQNAHWNFTEPKVMSSKSFCRPTKSPKPQNSSFTITNTEEKLQIFQEM